ncbi:MAG: cytochrome c [Bacteroidia bacterium]
MKNKIIIGILLIPAMAGILLQQSCAVTKITERTGVQLWSENCVRCHATPPPNVFTDEQWDIISTHMRVRASLTDDETNKIIEFINSANK